MITAHSPKITSNGSVELVATFPWIGGEVKFIASPNDSEQHGRDLYARAIAGEFGTVEPYIAPALTLVDFQHAHDKHINDVAIAHKYRDFATFAMRAGYPGPYQAEGITFATWMDQCNAAGYQILAEVQAGTRQAPATIEEYIALLPAIPQSLVI